ncbi:hypothetical protein CPB84DRAFT_1763482 [Gymnopilus junonius]|uniref:Uncharacterized protein n=1 Tax=Gymnopilus junonius TaxID=109634 RepID=A0A9P5TSV5_GYMJU|nr:hypothetical protein CPB84DRAFT_1763482 [Gymnopilus junonius]
MRRGGIARRLLFVATYLVHNYELSRFGLFCRVTASDDRVMGCWLVYKRGGLGLPHPPNSNPSNHVCLSGPLFLLFPQSLPLSWRSRAVRMVDKLVRTSKNGSLLFEPEIVYRIPQC